MSRLSREGPDGAFQTFYHRLDRSLTFHRDALGLELNASTGEFTFSKAGGVTLALSTGFARTLGGSPGSVEVVLWSTASISRTANCVIVEFISLTNRIWSRAQTGPLTSTIRMACPIHIRPEIAPRGITQLRSKSVGTPPLLLCFRSPAMCVDESAQVRYRVPPGRRSLRCRPPVPR